MKKTTKSKTIKKTDIEKLAEENLMDEIDTHMVDTYVDKIFSFLAPIGAIGTIYIIARIIIGLSN